MVGAYLTRDKNLTVSIILAEFQKILVSLFGKLYLPAECDKEKLFKLKLLLDKLCEVSILNLKTSYPRYLMLDVPMIETST
jgi:hypothetical protein